MITNPSTLPDDNGVNDGPDTPVTESRTLTLTVPANGRFEWHIPPSRSRQDPRREGRAVDAELRGGRRRKESRALAIERGQELAINLACGQATTSGHAGRRRDVHDPDGFSKVNVARNGRGLRISFTETKNAVTVAIYETSKGRTIVQDKRVALFRNRRAAPPGTAQTGGNKRRVARGVYTCASASPTTRRRSTRAASCHQAQERPLREQGKFVFENTCP